jgi:hypothetical protein
LTFFPRLTEIIGSGRGIHLIYAHMTGTNLRKMLIQLYLKLGLPLKEALRAAEADLKTSFLHVATQAG